MSRKSKTTTMKEEARPALVPKLRFPEFREAEGWDVEFLGDICQPQQWPTISSSALVGEGYPVYGANGFIGYYTDFNHEFETVAVTCRGSTCGEVSLIPPKSYITGNSMCLDGIDAVQYSYHFVYHLLKHRGFDDVISGSAQPQIVGSAIKRLRIALPGKPEQQKIAECLSSVDELMAAQARKVDALKTHKKGLMQQLFPREGETQPRLRFPEFQNAGEWEEGELGPKASKVGSGITPTGGDKNYRQAGRPFVRSQNVGWGILLLDDVAYIDEETHASFDSTEIKVRDVLLNITGASIGRSAVADDRIAGGNVNQHVCIIRTKPDELNPFFLNQYLISQRGQNQIDSFQAGGNRQGLNFAQIRSFAVPFPPPAEQQRIALCLSSLDALIAAETEKHEALKTHKKGLMQQLFPSPEEAEA